MCHGKGLQNKINNLREQALRIVYQHKESSFGTLLKCKQSASIHKKNLYYLTTEIFTVIFLWKPWKNFLFFKKIKLKCSKC